MKGLTRRVVMQAGLLGLGLHSVSANARHKLATPIPRIGFLIGDYPPFVAAFMDELRRLGYLLGKTIVVEIRMSRSNSGDLETQAAELARMNLNLIVAAALPQALAVRRHNPSMPMVVGTAPGLVSNGFARTLEHPGGNVTGMDELPSGITARRLSLLKLAAPSLSRIAALSSTPGTGGHEMQLADALSWAAAERVELKAYRVQALSELAPALAAIRADAMDGLISFQGALALSNAKLITGFAAHWRIPAIYQSKLFVDAGGLMSFAPDQVEQFRIAARYVDRILKGARPGDLPIAHPRRYFLTYNEVAASHLGLLPPKAFKAQIDTTVRT